ncbi:MAG: GIY-YIG nuclease family protein [Chlamydiae bacterium]|nr:MAG: GIY-YIG nuclease family protein [Chlamydiota bacterium]
MPDIHRVPGVCRANPLTPTIFIMYFVYILQSLSSGRFYIGSTDNILRRFHEHQSGFTKSTRNRGPWHMPYYEIHKDRSAATNRERELKRKKSAESIRRIISHG